MSKVGERVAGLASALSGCALLLGMIALVGAGYLCNESVAQGEYRRAEIEALKYEIKALRKEAALEDELLEELETLEAEAAERRGGD